MQANSVSLMSDTAPICASLASLRAYVMKKVCLMNRLPYIFICLPPRALAFYILKTMIIVKLNFTRSMWHLLRMHLPYVV